MYPKPLRINVPKYVKKAALSRGRTLYKTNMAMSREYYIPYSNFTKEVKAGKIDRVLILPGRHELKFENTEGEYGLTKLDVDSKLLEMMTVQDVTIDYKYEDQPGIISYIWLLLLPLMIYSLFARQTINRGQGGNAFNPFGDKFDVTEKTNICFDDVAGIDEAKNEIMEIVEFLRNPEKFKKAGAVIPKGCLVSGPPGTGKTLMAKAIAGEADVPLIACSASEFIELFVGIGASRIRDLFTKARKLSPCIIFIDEIDAIGKSRTNGMNIGGGGNDEREQTLNQLLTEMDGFGDNEGVIVIAATNREDVLDEALLRPGRFDRKINISLPNSEGRLKILKIHSKNKRLISTVNLTDLSKKTIGCSGADLMNIMNEASILAARDGRDGIMQMDLEEAFDKVSIGLKRPLITSDYMKRLVAYHEAGHALLGAMCDNFDKVSKVTILPRGGTGGVTQFIPDEDAMNNGIYSRDYLINRIIVGLGGRIAEEIVYGEDKVTTGAVNDIQVVTSMARTMVEKYGFSKQVGMQEINERQQRSISLQEEIDKEVSEIIGDAYTKGMNLLVINRTILDMLAERLIEEETVHGVDVYNLISNNEVKT